MPGAEAAGHDPRRRRRADELEDPGDLGVRVGDQVLVPDREAAVGEVLLGRDDGRRVVEPVPGQRGHVVVGRTADVRLEPVAGQTPRRRLDAGRDDIHRMPVQADESRLRPDPQQQPRVLRRPQALVAVPPLPPAPQVGGHHRVEAAPQPRGHRRGDRGVGRAAVRRGCGRPGVLDHRPRGGQLPGQPRQPGLGRAGQVRVGVEQEPQQGGARSAGAEHEDRIVASAARRRRPGSALPGRPRLAVAHTRLRPCRPPAAGPGPSLSCCPTSR